MAKYQVVYHGDVYRNNFIADTYEEAVARVLEEVDADPTFRELYDERVEECADLGLDPIEEYGTYEHFLLNYAEITEI